MIKSALKGLFLALIEPLTVIGWHIGFAICKVLFVLSEVAERFAQTSAGNVIPANTLPEDFMSWHKGARGTSVHAAKQVKEWETPTHMGESELMVYKTGKTYIETHLTQFDPLVIINVEYTGHQYGGSGNSKITIEPLYDLRVEPIPGVDTEPAGFPKVAADGTVAAG